MFLAHVSDFPSTNQRTPVSPSESAAQSTPAPKLTMQVSNSRIITASPDKTGLTGLFSLHNRASIFCVLFVCLFIRTNEILNNRNFELAKKCHGKDSNLQPAI